MNHTLAYPARIALGVRTFLPILALAGLTVLSGCSNRPMEGTTTLEFRGLTPQDANSMESLLRQNELRVVRKDGAGGTTFQTKDLTSGKQMGKLNTQIMELAERERIELTYEGTTFSYASLTASGTAMTTVTIQASPGATAFVADQDGRNSWRLIRLDRSGKWQGSVRTRGRVNDQNGWLYVAFTRDDKLYRYLRVNVLTGEQQTATYSQAQNAGLSDPSKSNVSTSDTGTNSATDAGAAPSSGWKWPWEK